MKLDPTKLYFMPLIMGAINDRPGNWIYAETESLVLQYLTDPDAIPPLLPDCYQPGANPLVSVAFMDSNGVSFLAGNGYRLASVTVAARYDGEEDHLDGDYILVMFENDATPIIGGREATGIHKWYADITSVETLDNGHLRYDVSIWGHPLYRVDIEAPDSQNKDFCSAASERSTQSSRFSYKYIPSLEGPPDADYPMVFRTNVTIEQLWTGKSGEFSFGNPGEKDIGYYKPILDALKSLPVRSIVQTAHSRGSQIIPFERCGRLR